MIDPEHIDFRVERAHNGMGGSTIVTTTFQISFRTEVDNRMLGDDPALIEQVKKGLKRKIWDKVYDNGEFREKMFKLESAVVQAVPEIHDMDRIDQLCRDLVRHYEMPEAPAHPAKPAPAVLAPLANPDDPIRGFNADHIIIDNAF